MNNPDWRKMMFTLIAVVIGLTLLISLLLMRRYRPPPRDRAAKLYQRFVKRSGLTPATGETPRAFEARAQQESPLPVESVHAITETYLDVRYGPPDPDLMKKLETEIATLS